MNLEQEIKRIIYGVNNLWTDLEKTRYVYIEVGKLVEKNSEFFFTQSGKLLKNALNEKEMSKINNVTKKSIENDDEWYKVICRSAAILLETILSRLGIKSHLIKTQSYAPLTPESKKKVYHWILSVDIDNTHYALTLAGDLPNIKNGFQTEHFAEPLEYLDFKGNPLYQGEKLDFSILTYPDLLEIDKKIGYITNYYYNTKSPEKSYNNNALKFIKAGLRNNSWFYEIVASGLPMYQNMYTIADGNGNKSNITSLDNKTIFTLYADELIKNCCIEVEKAIKDTYGFRLPILKYKSYEKWIENICIFLEDDLVETYGEKNRGIIEVPNDFSFKNWRKKQKGILKCPYKSYDDNLELLDNVDAYVGMIQSLRQAYKENNITEADQKKIKSLRSLHTRICEHFMPDIAVFEKNIEIVDNRPYIKSDYINEKFRTMFPIIFDVDGTSKDFNKLGYSEQIGTINKLVPYIFPEVTVANCNQAESYTNACKPSLNRIRTYCILNEITHEYELIIHIPSFFEFEDEFYYLYDLRKNTFKQVDILEDINNSNHYEILSATLKNKFKKANAARNKNRYQDIEDVEMISMGHA